MWICIAPHREQGTQVWHAFSRDLQFYLHTPRSSTGCAGC